MPKPNYAIARLNKTFSFRLYLEGFDALPTPQTIPADSYYVTDRRLDGEVTIRYTDSPLVPNPAKRDSGLRYRLFPSAPTREIHTPCREFCILQCLDVLSIAQRGLRPPHSANAPLTADGS